MKRFIILFVVNIEILKTLKYHTFSKKTLVLFTVSFSVKVKTYLKKRVDILNYTENLPILASIITR